MTSPSFARTYYSRFAPCPSGGVDERDSEALEAVHQPVQAGVELGPPPGTELVRDRQIVASFRDPFVQCHDRGPMVEPRTDQNISRRS